MGGIAWGEAQRLRMATVLASGDRFVKASDTDAQKYDACSVCFCRVLTKFGTRNDSGRNKEQAKFTGAFEKDPAKRARFDAFMKEQQRTGLRNMDASGPWLGSELTQAQV